MAGRRITAGGTLVLDSEGLSKLAAGDARTRGYLDSARARGARVAVSAITLTEVLRGGSRDTAVHRVLARIIVVPVTTAGPTESVAMKPATSCASKCSSSTCRAGALRSRCGSMTRSSSPRRRRASRLQRAVNARPRPDRGRAPMRARSRPRYAAPDLGPTRPARPKARGRADHRR